jgi:hypothetical protein
MPIEYRPVGLTHILIAFIFAIALLGINAIEFYFMARNNALTPNSLNLFWIILQNIGVAIPNSYYLSKIQVSTTGLSEQTKLTGGT